VLKSTRSPPFYIKSSAMVFQTKKSGAYGRGGGVCTWSLLFNSMNYVRTNSFYKSKKRKLPKRASKQGTKNRTKRLTRRQIRFK
jgi:hypothetical protein